MESNRLKVSQSARVQVQSEELGSATVALSEAAQLRKMWRFDSEKFVCVFFLQDGSQTDVFTVRLREWSKQRQGSAIRWLIFYI